MKHKLLLIGDSIRRSYQPLVETQLAGKCELIGVDIGISCKDTRTTLELVDEVIANSDATIIHWNNGLHDISCLDGRQCRTPIDEYQRNIEELFTRLNKTAPGGIIWANTTPVIEQRHNTVKSFCRFNKDIDAYNKIAGAIMKKHNVPINDLNSVIAENPETYIRQDGVHFTEQGRLTAANAVAAAIRSFIAEKD